MIHPNEYRIGNFVCDLVSGEWMRVTEINLDNIGAELIRDPNYVLPQHWEMGPIKLTPEILEKVFGGLGFGSGHSYCGIDGKFRYEGRVIEYVHDLQNVAFYACGKTELPVNLEYATQRDKKTDK